MKNLCRSCKYINAGHLFNLKVDAYILGLAPKMDYNIHNTKRHRHVMTKYKYVIPSGRRPVVGGRRQTGIVSMAHRRFTRI